MARRTTYLARAYASVVRMLLNDKSGQGVPYKFQRCCFCFISSVSLRMRLVTSLGNSA